MNYNLNGGRSMDSKHGQLGSNPTPCRSFACRRAIFVRYGRFAGGVVDVVTKSGTNQLRVALPTICGTASQRQPLAARQASAKDPLHGIRRKRVTPSSGPHLHLWQLLGTKEADHGISKHGYTVDGAKSAGDLSTGGTPVDPLTNVAFPGRLIPVNRFDPVAKKIFEQYIPLPNLPKGLYEVQIPHPNNTDELVVKADHNLNAAHRLTGSVYYTTGEDVVGLLGNIEWVTRNFQWKQFNYNADDTWIVSPSKINVFHVQYLRDFGGRDHAGSAMGSTYHSGRPRCRKSGVGRFSLNGAIPGRCGGNLCRSATRWHPILAPFIKVGGERFWKMIHDTPE